MVASFTYSDMFKSVIFKATTSHRLTWLSIWVTTIEKGGIFCLPLSPKKKSNPITQNLELAFRLFEVDTCSIVSFHVTCNQPTGMNLQ